MTNETWQAFADQVSSNLISHNTPSTISTSESLETTWHKLQTSIINAALIHIPNKKFAVRNFHHSFSSKATLLHYNLKKLNSIIKQTKHSLNSGTPIPLYHNSTITYLNSTHQLQLPPIPLQSNLIPNWITNAKEAWKSLYHARNLENIKYTRQQILESINTRCSKLVTQPKSMINSILNRHKDPVRINNIKSNNAIITEPSTIKTHIQNHFDEWTAPRQINEHLFNSYWANEYLPKQNIDSSWYSEALHSFTIEEILDTLSQLPNNKACGPSGISYEMIKHSGNNCLLAIISLFNRCLTAQTVPKQWKEGHIFPISKKPIFDGNLTNT